MNTSTSASEQHPSTQCRQRDGQLQLGAGCARPPPSRTRVEVRHIGMDQPSRTFMLPPGTGCAGGLDQDPGHWFSAGQAMDQGASRDPVNGLSRKPGSPVALATRARPGWPILPHATVPPRGWRGVLTDERRRASCPLGAEARLGRVRAPGRCATVKSNGPLASETMNTGRAWLY